VGELVATILEHWPGAWLDQSDPTAPHEANLLHLQIDKAHHRLGWQPRWDDAATLCAKGSVFWWEERPWVVIFSQDGRRVVTTYPTDERTLTNRRGGGRWIFPNF